MVTVIGINYNQSARRRHKQFITLAASVGTWCKVVLCRRGQCVEIPKEQQFLQYSEQPDWHRLPLQPIQSIIDLQQVGCHELLPCDWLRIIIIVLKHGCTWVKEPVRLWNWIMNLFRHLRVVCLFKIWQEQKAYCIIRHLLCLLVLYSHASISCTFIL